MGDNKEKKCYRDNYSKVIKMPAGVGKRYEDYCKKTHMKMSETLRVLVLESIPRLHDAENLDQIIEKARKQNAYTAPEKYKEVHVRLPASAVQEIDTYCKFFQLKSKRCHFMYYLIEAKLQKTLGDVLHDE